MKQKNGKWIIEKSQVKYQNPWINVVEDKVIRPDKKKGIYGTVEIKPGVAILAMDKYENIYLVREFQYPLGKKLLQVPGGGIEKDLSPLKNAKKELREELGIKAKKWTYLGKFNILTGLIKTSVAFFLARDIEFEKAKREATESIKLVKIKLPKALNMIMQNKIQESITEHLILKSARYLKK